MSSALYQCPRCTLQAVGPSDAEPRLCRCSNHYAFDKDEHWEEIGTVDEPVDGFELRGHAAETLQVGFGVRYESRRTTWEAGHFRNWETQDKPVPGEIHEVQETGFGPRYGILPDLDWWRPEEGVEEDTPLDHVYHWDIVEVSERTRPSSRLADLRGGEEA